MLYSILVVVDALLAIAVVVLILLNRGRGAEVGAAFGGSASSASVFGSKGATPFITKAIAVLAGLFLMNSLGLAYLANFQYEHRSIVDEVGLETLQPPADEADDVPDEFGDDIPDEFGDDTTPDIPN